MPTLYEPIPSISEELSRIDAVMSTMQHAAQTVLVLPYAQLLEDILLPGSLRAWIVQRFLRQTAAPCLWVTAWRDGDARDVHGEGTLVLSWESLEKGLVRLTMLSEFIPRP